jgi:hypothetical protein
MHQTVKVSSVGSVGDLGRVASALGSAGYNIEAVGGGEAANVREDGRGVGVMSFLVMADEDADVAIIKEILENLDLDDNRRLADVQVLPSLDVELRHVRGALGLAAAALGGAGINIQSVLLVDAHRQRAVVSLAFLEADVDAARTILDDPDHRFRVLPKHGGKDLRDHHGDDDGPGHPVHDDGPGH